MDRPRVAGLLVPASTAPPLRLGRLADLERLFGPAWWQGEDRAGLVAAAVALLEGVPRVIVAASLDALGDAAVVAVVGSVSSALWSALTAREPALPPVLVDLPSDASPASLAAARLRGVRAVAPGGHVLLPGARRPIAIGGATIALPLMFGRSTLGPLIELASAPPVLDPPLADDVLVLRSLRAPRSAPRAALPPGERPLAPEAPADDTHHAADHPARATARHAEGPEAARIGAALDALAQRYAHRLARDQGSIATLEREVERVLQAEAASGAITGYAFSIEPTSPSQPTYGLTGAGRADAEAGEDLAIEVVLRLPKRVGQVIVRTSRM